MGAFAGEKIFDGFNYLKVHRNIVLSDDSTFHSRPFCVTTGSTPLAAVPICSESGSIHFSSKNCS